ncbi:ABC transporter substrate-binding protein [Dactylosporangium sp. NPDC000555]|uniref:ABC transporter substrate-binding protein n=1 Tax=Dactylosporangium sp. NPDC000555 TaxID=3154260 RepID=UPI00332299C8
MAAATTFALAGCGGGEAGGESGDAETGRIRVVTSVSKSFPFVVVQAGKRLGTWEGTGLDVQVIEGTTPTIGQIMAGGQADIALAGATTEVANAYSGLPVTVVASNLNYWDQRVIVRAGGATSVEALKGGNFGITGAGSPGHYSIEKMAERLGWSKNDYKLTSLGNIQALQAALASGSIDAFTWSSDKAFTLEQSGEGRILAPASEYVGDNVLQSFAVMDSFLKAKPKLVQKFFESYFATVQKIQAQPQLFIDVMVQDWKLDPAVADRLAKETLPKLSIDGVISQAELKGLADSVTFSINDPKVKVDSVKYTYWKDLK